MQAERDALKQVHAEEAEKKKQVAKEVAERKEARKVVKSKAKWEESVKKREAQRETAFVEGRDELKESVENNKDKKINYPPNRAYTPEARYSTLMKGRNKPVLQHPEFMYADVTAEPPPEEKPGTRNHYYWKPLVEEVEAVSNTAGFTQAKNPGPRPSIAVRCRMDQVSSLCREFDAVNMVADAPYIIGITQL